jgi:type I restriction-modification system DNA methylase subunit/ankyrin repeat protein
MPKFDEMYNFLSNGLQFLDKKHDEKKRMLLIMQLLYLKLLNDNKTSVYPETVNGFSLKELSIGDVNKNLKSCFSQLHGSQEHGLLFSNHSYQEISKNEIRALLQHLERYSFAISPKDDKDMLNSVLARAIEKLLKDFVELYINRKSIYFIDPLATKMMSSLLFSQANTDIDNPSVYDPSAVIGFNLLYAAREMAKRFDSKLDGCHFYGQEEDPWLAEICLLNLLLHGIKNVHIASGDPISAPAFLDKGHLKQFSYVMMNTPPLRKWSHEYAQADPYARFYLGVPGKAYGDQAIFMHALASIAQGGRAAIVVNPGILMRDGVEKQVRTMLAESKRLQKVIALPLVSYKAGNSLQSNLLYIENTDNNSSHILLADLEAIKSQNNRLYEEILTTDDWVEILEELARTNQRIFAVNIANQTKYLPAKILKADLVSPAFPEAAGNFISAGIVCGPDVEYNRGLHLSPYTLITGKGATDEDWLWEIDQDKIADYLVVKEYNKLIPMQHLVYSYQDRYLGTVSLDVQAYEKGNLLPLKDIAEVFRGVMVGDENVSSEAHYTHLMLNLSDVQDGIINFSTMGKYDFSDNYKKYEKYELQEGDLLVSCRGTQIKIAIFPPHKDKVILSQNFIALRLKSNYFPEYVRLMLESPVGQYYFNSLQAGAATYNFSVKDIEEIQIPNKGYIEQSLLVCKMKGLELLHEHEQYIQKLYYLKNKIGLLKGSGLAEYMKITEELKSADLLNIYASYNNYYSAKNLLENGANPNQPDDMGFTPLMVAAYRDNRKVARLLLDHGADPNALGPFGRTALFFSQLEPNTVGDMLIDAGANTEIQDDWGSTVLHYATINNDVDYHLFNHLGIIGPENMTRQDKLGRTPLFHLIANHDFETISSYLEFEYSNWDDRYSFLTEQSKIKDIEGNALGHILALSNTIDEDLSIHDWLSELISNVQNKDGDTPLHLLVKLHDSSTIRQLSYEGIDKDQLNAPNNDGYTPLQLAELSGDMEILELLTR